MSPQCQKRQQHAGVLDFIRKGSVYVRISRLSNRLIYQGKDSASQCHSTDCYTHQAGSLQAAAAEEEWREERRLRKVECTLTLLYLAGSCSPLLLLLVTLTLKSKLQTSAPQVNKFLIVDSEVQCDCHSRTHSGTTSLHPKGAQVIRRSRGL